MRSVCDLEIFTVERKTLRSERGRLVVDNLTGRHGTEKVREGSNRLVYRSEGDILKIGEVE